MLLAIAAAGLFCSLHGPALAQDSAAAPNDPQARRMIAAFKEWASRWNIPNTSLAIMRGKKLLGTFGKGTHTPNTAVGVASESKAITAMCIAKLVDAGKLKFNTRLNAILSKYFASHPPSDPRVKGITIGQLLTHTSGMTDDPSQGGKILQLPLNHINFEKQATIAFESNLGTVPGKAYYYNNMNYALLGLVIETITKTPYAKRCYNSVLKPAGVTSSNLVPEWRVLSSWGGWKISAVNYARFLAYFLPSQKLIKTPVSQWPKAALGGGASYSLGTLMRRNGAGHNFWHNGTFSWDDPPASFGAYHVLIGESVRYVANYEPTLTDAALSNLDEVMYAAATGIRNAEPPLQASQLEDDSD